MAPLAVPQNHGRGRLPVASDSPLPRRPSPQGPCDEQECSLFFRLPSNDALCNDGDESSTNGKCGTSTVARASEWMNVVDRTSDHRTLGVLCRVTNPTFWLH